MSIIIIVDDELSNFYRIEKAVKETKGFISFHAQDSRSFFKLIKRVIPDFIFLKVLMPGPNAMSCLKKLRSIEKYDMVPVIVYSEEGDYEKEAYRNRANLYITKLDSFDEASVAIKFILTFDWRNNTGITESFAMLRNTGITQ